MSRLRTKPGSALLLAALTASLLGAAAGALLIAAQSARASAGEAWRLEQARLEASSLLSQALVKLDAGEPLAQSGVIVQSGQARVVRQDASGLVDLNAADPDQLAALFQALGIDEQTSADLADRIADWRDGDDLKRLHGAERDDYFDAHLPPPANRPFELESELALVLGFNADLVRCVSPYVTVYAGASAIDASAAPAVLRALPHVSVGASENAPAPMGRVIVLTAAAPISPRALLALREWVRFTGDANTPIFVHRAEEALVPIAAQPSTSCTAGMAS